MEYLKVKNWDKFQHYKHRSPPWIKLHQSLLSDYDFQCLRDASKAHLILLWLWASNHDGAVPNDPLYLKRCLGLRSAPDLKGFIKQGFLISNASNALSTSKQSADTEESRVKKIREERSTPAFRESDVDKNRRIAEYLASGNLDAAKRLRDT